MTSLLLNCAVRIAGHQPRQFCLETSGPRRIRSRFGDFRGCEFGLVVPAYAGSLDKSEQFRIHRSKILTAAGVQIIREKHELIEQLRIWRLGIHFQDIRQSEQRIPNRRC